MKQINRVDDLVLWHLHSTQSLKRLTVKHLHFTCIKFSLFCDLNRIMKLITREFQEFIHK